MIPEQKPIVPGYWLNETGGELAPAMRNYLAGKVLSEDEIRLIRAYLVQWVAADWRGTPSMIKALRQRAGAIETRADIRAVIGECCDLGFDPL